MGDRGACRGGVWRTGEQPMREDKLWIVDVVFVAAILITIICVCS